MGQFIDIIHSCMNTILNPDSSCESLNDAVEGIRKLFSDITGESAMSDMSNLSGRITPHGYSLDPMGALNCISDVLRTVKYMRGINIALKDLRNLLPDSIINIVYAGCGPFASLLLPLAATMNLSKMKMYLVDINLESLQNVRMLIQGLELSEEPFELICADASTFRFNSELSMHMLITETMYPALNKEPQVAITLNLASQLYENGILIPQEVIINAFVSDPAVEFSEKDKNKRSTDFLDEIKSRRTSLGKVFSLGLTKINECKDENGEIDTAEIFKLEAGEIIMPKSVRQDDALMLATRIIVYKDIVIEEYESGLTAPFIYDKEYNKQPGAVLKFYYEISEYPRFIIGS